MQTCSICQRDINGYGNNAWPVNEGRCCNDCNTTVVIPARIAQLPTAALAPMTEYTVTFQKGATVGARRFRMVHVEALNDVAAVKLAKRQFAEPGFAVTRVDHFEDGRIVRDQ